MQTNVAETGSRTGTTPNTAAGTVSVDILDGVGIVAINRPSHRNAFSRAMCLELTEAMRALDRDPRVRVITLRGVDGNFSAGAGLDQFDEVLFDQATQEDSGTDRLSEADAAITSVRKPTVALVEGVCMGGGWQIAAAADIVLASSTTRIAITPAKLGILYPRFGLERLRELVGVQRAKYLVMSASEVSAETAQQWGLITQLFDEQEFVEQTSRIVRSISQKSQFSTTTMKRLLDTYGEAYYDEDWRRSWHEFRTGEDLAAGRAAFAEKRRPDFTWRLPDSESLS